LNSALFGFKNEAAASDAMIKKVGCAMRKDNPTPEKPVDPFPMSEAPRESMVVT
jgi:hypothetical protein